MDHKEFIKHITYLSMAYNKEFNEQQCMVWYDSFKNVKSDDLAKAIKYTIRTSKFYPTIADLLEKCENLQVYLNLELIEKMIKDNYFKDASEIQKARMWAEKDCLPGWLKKDMEEYGQALKLKNIGVRMIENE